MAAASLTIHALAMLAAGASFRPPPANRIAQMATACDGASLNVTITMQQPFKGSLFAKEFAQECRAPGTMRASVAISLPTSGCGVRLSADAADGQLRFSVALVLQQDKHLRQASDVERVASCAVAASAFAVRGPVRRGARKSGGGEDEEAAGRAWMEIVPSGERRALQVGEEALLVVRTALPSGVGWRVVDCVAHDGLGDAAQKLLAADGCPLDEALLPAPRMGPPRADGVLRHQEAVARFAAFKFPDRDRLHLACGLQLCRTRCAPLACANDTRTARRDDVLDRLEVFNSVEVSAPGIELDERDRLADRLAGDPLRAAFGRIPGDRAFCVSADAMAVAFCVLGVLFLGGVAVAAGALLKARRAAAVAAASRSLFSTSSAGSAGGSRLQLLRDSPPSTASLRGYGRIL